MAATYIVEKLLATFPCPKLTEMMTPGYVHYSDPATEAAHREEAFRMYLNKYINSLPERDRPKRGDIVLLSENNQYGYGFWTGNRIILLDRVVADYGTVPNEFCAIDEFHNIRHFYGGSKYSYFPIGPGARRRIIFGKVLSQTKDEFVFSLTLDGLKGVGYVCSECYGSEPCDLTDFRITPALADRFFSASYNMSEGEDHIHTEDNEELDRAFGEADMILSYTA